MHFKRLKRAFTQNLHFFGGHPVVALKMLRKTVEAYIIKWIISGEPLVDLKVGRTQNEVTVEPYIISLIRRHPVYIHIKLPAYHGHWRISVWFV